MTEIAMARGRFVILQDLSLPSTGLSGFLSRPFLLIFGALLAMMLSLSVAHPGLHAMAMAARWPALGTVAFFGLCVAARRGVGPVGFMPAALAIFLAVASASAGYSSDPNYTAMRAASLCLLFLATIVGLRSYCRSVPNAIAFTDMLWIFGSVMVIAGFFFTRGSMGPSGRYLGLHDRATVTGSYAGIMLPIAVYQARYRLKGALKMFGWLIVGLLFLQILLAAARTALVVSTLVCLALWFEYYGRKAVAALALIALVAPVPFLLDYRQARGLERNSERIIRSKTVSTFTGRLQRWQFGLEQFCKKPAYGRGFGISRRIAIEEGAVASARSEYSLHSDQIEVLVDLGLVGYAPFALFWMAFLGLTARTVLAPASPVRQLRLAYLGGAFYAFVDTFMHGGFLSAGGGFSTFTWSMLAVALALDGSAPMLRRRFRAAVGAVNEESRVKNSPLPDRIDRSRLSSARKLFVAAERPEMVSMERSE